MSIQRSILDNDFYRVGDFPMVFPNAYDNPEKLVGGLDVQRCLNNPWWYNIEMLDSNNMKVPMPTVPEQWHDKFVPEKSVIFELANSNHTFVIGKYGHHNCAVEELLDEIESRYYVNCDAHVYGALGGASSFKIHWDQPANLIIQIEGETDWTVYNERCSTLIKYDGYPYNPTEEEVTPCITHKMLPGDVLYIPARQYHCARPHDKRLSLSIPMWHDPEYQSDRKEHQLSYTKPNK